MQPAKLIQMLEAALKKRESIRAGNAFGETDALRIVDGRGDGFEDLEIDDFAGHWLVQTRGALNDECLMTNDRMTSDRMTSDRMTSDRMTSDRMTSDRMTKKPAQRNFVIRASSFFRHSDFVIRHFSPRSIYWKKLGEKTAPVWIAGERVTELFIVRENGIRYWIDFQSGYSQGLFLDQRENRAVLRARAANKTVLNCFAYTCAFGLCAALGGAAKTVNVDLSKNYLEWGKRNYLLNNVNLDADPAAHEFFFGDAQNWLERFAKKSRRFDLIILDPPTFSRDKHGKVFTIESNFQNLIRAAEKILTPNGAIFCSTNQRTLSQTDFRSLITRGLADARAQRIRYAPMPADFTGEKYLKSAWINA